MKYEIKNICKLIKSKLIMKYKIHEILMKCKIQPTLMLLCFPLLAGWVTMGLAPLDKVKIILAIRKLSCIKSAVLFYHCSKLGGGGGGGGQNTWLKICLANFVYFVKFTKNVFVGQKCPELRVVFLKSLNQLLSLFTIFHIIYTSM